MYLLVATQLSYSQPSGLLHNTVVELLPQQNGVLLWPPTVPKKHSQHSLFGHHSGVFRVDRATKGLFELTDAIVSGQHTSPTGVQGANGTTAKGESDVTVPQTMPFVGTGVRHIGPDIGNV